MAKRAPLPQFGEWKDNVQYTAYFENARQNKGKMINPNDPEQNPEAFNYEQRTPERPRNPNQAVNGNGNINAVRQSPQHRLQEKRSPEVTWDIPQRPRNPNQAVNGNGNINAVRQSPQHRMQERKSPEVSRDRSYSEHSNDRFNHRGRNGRPSAETYPSPSHPQGAIKSADSQYANAHNRVASVPKFGAWDETNPQSGDGFTIIFDKVKNQKQNSANNFQTAPNESVTYPSGNQNKIKTSSKSKMWNCCFP